MELEGILNACTTKVLTKRAMANAMMRVSAISRPLLFFVSGIRSVPPFT